MLIDDGRQILAALNENLLCEEDVRSWSYSTIERLPADELPEWLVDLATYGPIACLNRPASEFLDVPYLPFRVSFSVRVQTTDFANTADAQAFIQWISRACLAEDLSHPEVQFGYQIDHLWHDCARADLCRELIAKELPRLSSQLVTVSDELLRLVANAKGCAARR